MRTRLLFVVCVCFCVLILSGGVQPAIAGPSEKGVSGSLNVNGDKVNLVHAYVDEADPDEPIVVLSDKALPAEAIPFLPEKLVKEQKVHAVVFSISRKDKKLTNTYGKVYYPGQESGVGMGRVEDGKVTLVITQLDATMIEGKIATPKPVKFLDISYSFDASFKVSLGKKSDNPSGKSAALEISVTGDTSPPAKAYAEYHKACIARDVKNIRDFLTSENQKEFDSYDKGRNEAVIDILKMRRPAKIKIGKPIVAGDKVSFTVEGLETPGGKATGSIKMIIEDRKWKVSEDKWEISYK